MAWLHFLGYFVSLHMASAGTGVCRFQQSTNILKNFLGRNYLTLDIFQELPKRLNIYAISTLCAGYRTLTRDALKILDAFRRNPSLNEFSVWARNELEFFVTTFLQITVRFRKLNLLMSRTLQI